MDSIMPLYDAIQTHRYNYDSGDTDYSVTTLLSPPRVVHLKKRHEHKVDLFIEDLLYSWTGTASHNYMEDCLKEIVDGDGKPKYKLEERLRVVINNRKISGAYDVLWKDKLSLWDMKNTSTWKVIFGDKHEWAAQQNMYRYLYWIKYKELIKELHIIGMFRDWSMANKMRGGKQYPEKPVVSYQLPLWDVQKTYDFMVDRVNVMIADEDKKDDDLTRCTHEDMWCSQDKVAVKTSRLKRALRVCDNMKAAKKWVSEYMAGPACKDKIDNIVYDVRPSTRTRCESWCPVNVYCNQYHEYLKKLAMKGSK